jgi:ssDNA-binding Zn-finger/Zn-ribbon topoisomerase 1
MPVHVRVCRECGEEYRPGVVRCADCGGELEDRFEGEAEGARPSSATREEPPSELVGYRVLFLTPRAADLVPMAERLRESGVEYRLGEPPGRVEGAPARYALLVKDADAAGALAALADLVAPHEGTDGVHAVESRFDGEHGYRQCPACGAQTAKGAAECPECGLGLAGAEGEVEEPRE